MKRGRPSHPDVLTPREWEVLALIRKDLSNQQIADRLGISESGVRYHVSEILAKLGVSTRQEAAAADVRPRASRVIAILGILWRTSGHLKWTQAAVLGAAVVSAIVVGILAANLLVDSGSEPPSSPSGKLAFIQDGNLWVKELPDGKSRQLTTEGGGRFPSWSASGQWLTLSQSSGDKYDQGTWVIETSGASKRHLDAVSFPTWSPDEDRIAYVRLGGDLVIEDASGSDKRVVTPSEEGEEIKALTWLPGGLHLAYASTNSQVSSIWLYDLKAGSSRSLFSDSSGADLVPRGTSADGSHVLFFRFPQAAQATEMQLWSVPISGGEARDLQLQEPRFQQYVEARRAGDGTVIADAARVPTMNQGLIVFNGGGAATLSRHDTFALSPAWSPDSTKVAYTSEPEKEWASDNILRMSDRRLWLMNADETNKKRMTSDDVAEEWPQWSRDGRFLLMVRPALGQNELVFSGSIWIARVRDLKLTKLVDRVDFGRSDYSSSPLGSSSSLNWAQLFAWWQAP